AYPAALEPTASGARATHPRAVELGAPYDVPIRVGSSFRDDPGYQGTLIARRPHVMEELALTGLASERGNARITLRGLPASMNVLATLLNRLAEIGRAHV